MTIHNIPVTWDAPVKLLEKVRKYLITISVSDLVGTFVQGSGSSCIIDVERSPVVHNMVLEREKNCQHMVNSYNIVHSTQ